MRVVANPDQVAALIEKLAEAVARDVAPAKGRAPWALVGLRSRGDVLARRLAAKLQPDHVGTLDITLYRDDLSAGGAQAVVRTTEIPFAIDGLNVVLVDDVLMTGRSVRAALQSLMDLGRPRRVWLSVLVDRGGRELPIAADHAALDLTGRAGKRKGDQLIAAALAPGEMVDVHLMPTDARDEIVVRTPEEAPAPGSGADE